SHDVCFIPHGATARFLTEHIGSAPGEIIDTETGAVVGTHTGAHAFTIGQRRGLRLARPAADGRPRYVVSVSPATSTVTIGPVESLGVSRIVATAPRWCSDPPGLPVTCSAQVRAHGE